MAKIICPNKGYTGISASVAFADGVGETDKPHLIKWFKEHGYTVEQNETQGSGEGGEGGFGNMTVKELMAYAEEKKIDLDKAKTKPEMIAAIQKAEGGEDNDGDDNSDNSNGEGGED